MFFFEFGLSNVKYLPALVDRGEFSYFPKCENAKSWKSVLDFHDHKTSQPHLMVERAYLD
jgi:hypothetical protein